ncbi:MAG: histidine phosphatase family protein [Candidatus Thorarchaeota archaeon]|nr:histidine phosphatase family protein [Candidatus Thorarchaeota archaeon]
MRADTSIALVVRHSHRTIIADYEQVLRGGLTETGKATSYEMGRRLDTRRPVHMFTSFVPRCAETTEHMARGLADAGGTVVDIEPLPTLVKPEHTEERVWENLQPDGDNVIDFVNRWSDGTLGEGIEEFRVFGARLWSDTVERLLSQQDPVMHIHVTHDLSLMSLKRLLLRRPLVEADREPYLGGIGLVRTHSGVQLFIGRDKSLIEIIV